MAENISDSIPIYTKLLNDVNSCLNLFNKLESNRTWGDWFVGDRSKINSEGLLEVTKEFKKLLEQLLPIYTTLSSNIERGKKMELEYQGRSKSNSQLDYFEDESIARQVKVLSTPKSTPKVVYSLCKEQTCKLKTTGYVAGGAVGGVIAGVGGRIAYTGTIAALAITGPVVLIPVGVGLAIGGIAASACYYMHSGSRKRGLEYQKLKVLYDYLDNTDLLPNLQTNCVIMQQLSDDVVKQLETYKLEFGTHQQAIVQKDARKEIAKVSKLYINTLLTEIEQLKSSEPDMGEDMRKRMATKIAASSCKTFLKQSLDYSDSDAQEFIDDLQS